MAKEMAGTVKFTRVNTAMEQQLALQFNIRGVPALILFRGGKKIKEITGAMPKPQLVQWIRDAR